MQLSVAQDADAEMDVMSQSSRESTYLPPPVECQSNLSDFFFVDPIKCEEKVIDSYEIADRSEQPGDARYSDSAL